MTEQATLNENVGENDLNLWNTAKTTMAWNEDFYRNG